MAIFVSSTIVEALVELVIVFLARRFDPAVAPRAVGAHDTSISRSCAVLAVGVAEVAVGSAAARKIEDAGDERTEGWKAGSDDTNVDL